MEPDTKTVTHVQVSEETLRILDVLARLVLELFERYEQGFEFILVRDIPVELLKEFDEKIVKPFYPGGRSEAVQGLMRKSIQEEQK